MKNINQPPAALRAAVAISAIAAIGIVAAPASGACASIAERGRPATLATPAPSRSLDVASVSTLVQGDIPSSDDDKDVPPKMVEKYTNAYKAMQKDHNMTADQAAAAQGLTIAQFRSIEGRIERDDTLRERVRKALRGAAPGAKETSNQ